MEQNLKSEHRRMKIAPQKFVRNYEVSSQMEHAERKKLCIYRELHEVPLKYPQFERLQTELIHQVHLKLWNTHKYFIIS